MLSKELLSFNRNIRDEILYKSGLDPVPPILYYRCWTTCMFSSKMDKSIHLK
jgi:hypothetical protein